MKLKPFVLEEWLKNKEQDVYITELEFNTTGRHSLVKDLVYFANADHSNGQPVLCGLREYGNEEDLGIALWDKNGNYTDDLGENLMLVDKDPLDELRKENESLKKQLEELFICFSCGKLLTDNGGYRQQYGEFFCSVKCHNDRIEFFKKEFKDPLDEVEKFLRGKVSGGVIITYSSVLAYDTGKYDTYKEILEFIKKLKETNNYV